MKVLHVIPSISKKAGGPSQAIIPMCLALQEQGIDLLLATTDDNLPANAVIEYEHPTSFHGVPTIFFPKQLGASFKYSKPFSRWLGAHISDYDVVHIHAVFNHACIAAARAARQNRVPYVVRPLGTLDPWGMKQKPLRKKLFWHAAAKDMLAHAAAVHYTSNGEKRAVEGSLKLNHGFVVPLGIDVDGAGRAHNDPAGFFPVLRDCPYVLVLSRLLPTKGLDVLLDSFLSLTTRNALTDWRLVLAGDGPTDYVASLKEFTRRQNATERVSFAGWVDGEKKNWLLRNASLLALPSHHENFGLCVLESLACGVPVLVSPNVNLSPEIQAADAGWVAEVDKDSIESALAAALASEDERIRRGEAGLNLAKSYAWPTIAGRLVDLYAAVLDGRN